MKLLFFVSCLVLFFVAVTAQVISTTPVFYYSNSYILDDGTNVVIIDTGINITHVNRLVTALTSLGSRVITGIFITHGHPDHYSGLAFFPAIFNTVPVWVANQQVKNELLENLLTNQANLPVNVTSFPYNARIQVLPGPTLTGLARNLTVLTTFSPAESAHFGLVLDPVDLVLWSGDLLYKNVHAYFGPTLSVSRVQKWIDDLQLLVSAFPSGNLFPLYPGHGGTALNSINEVLQFQFYLKRFLGLINDCTPVANLPAQMIHLFPRYNSTQSFLNFIALNPAWATYQSVACDTTNSTRAVLCANLNRRESCNWARPLCAWVRSVPNGRRRARPNQGNCLPSLRPVKPSQPFGP